MSNAEQQQIDPLNRRIVVRDSEAIPRVNEIRSSSHYLDQMKRIGIDTILEEYAGGMMPVEIAASREWPIRLFSKWLNDNADKDELDEVKKLCAQSFAARGMAILTMPRRDAADATLMSAFARHATNAASKLDPSTWGGSEQSAFGGGSVTFVLNIDNPDKFSGRVVTNNTADTIDHDESNKSLTLKMSIPPVDGVSNE